MIRFINNSDNGYNNKFYIISVTLFFFSFCTYRIFYSYSLGEEFIITLIPDDAYYYLKIAENKIYKNIWSFDGFNSSSGFHFLYAYICYFILLITDLEFLNLFFLLSFLSVILMTFSLFFTLLFSKKFISKDTYIVSAIPFFYSISFNQTTFMVESPYVIFFLILNLYTIFSNNNLTLNKTIILILCGILGSLARTDFGGFTLILFIVFFISNFFKNNFIALNSFLSLIGSTIGLLFTLLNNYMSTGEFLQSSSKIKYFWSSFSKHSVDPILHVFKNLIFFSSNNKMNFLIILFLIICFMVSLFNIFLKKKFFVNSTLLLITLIFIIIFYMKFYSYNSAAIQPWYVVYFIIPVAVSYPILLDNLIFNIKILSKYKKLGIKLGFVFILIIILKYQNNFNELWVHQKYSLEVSKKIENKIYNEKIGSWNAGTFSYFSKKKIINIDGLVNNEVINYILDGELLNYLIQNKIYSIIDSDYMIFDKKLQERGGYSDKKFVNCLEKIHSFETNYTMWKNENISIYRLKNGCLNN